MARSTPWLVIFALSILTTSVGADKNDDLINNLPGLSFNPKFKQYSGYLDASTGNYLHYWLVESQRNPSWDPLVLWLNGGPGCSSLGGLFTELGPFRVQPDGKTIVENVNSWNKVANVLFLEAPRDVGYSYRDVKQYGNDTIYNDYKTASDNALAIKSFFQRFPEYSNRPFYVTGESYGGVYVPTLTNLLISMIQNGSLPNVNLVGMAVGNGELSAYKQTNSAIDLLYYRGMLGTDEYQQLQVCCQDNSGAPLSYCDFSKYISVGTFGDLLPKNNTNDPVKNNCANTISKYAQDLVWNTYNDVYNSYQDCYNFSSANSVSQQTARLRAFKSVLGSKTLRSYSDSKVKTSISASTSASSSSSNPFVDQGSLFNTQSTDASGGFACYMDAATENYLNLPEVRKALNIRPESAYWQDCNLDMNGKWYEQQNHDMTEVFSHILFTGYPLKMLIYNGDVDMACNFQGDEWFIEDLAYNNHMSSSVRAPWLYTKPNGKPVLAGYMKTFNYRATINITLLTVKGAGHFVPLDRPGPALQMITNFISGNTYNSTTSIDLTPQPLLPQYAPAPQPSWTRKQADRIWSLPGLTYNINFKQYSGYLNGVAGNSLHYWFVESQSNPTTDPLVLWLNGGPGCSSLMGFLSELGPFHPNPDGKTLFENVYSWNKGANILFLESPRNVGFSVQNTTVNPDTIYNDEKTAWDSFLALKDFFTVYPEYNGRSFYVTGESYGGVYVPTLTSLLIDQIQAGNFTELNLVGMAVGNGELSALQQINSAIHLLYFHGLYGKQEWDQLQQCCNSTGSSDPKWFEYCDFSRYINLGPDGNASPIDNGVCGKLVVSLGQERVWNSINDVYNIYQDCYEQTTKVFGSRSVLAHKIAYKKKLFAASFVDQGAQVSMVSTDNQGGFQCYAGDAAAQYLNTPDVRDALHILPNSGNWSSCNDHLNEIYIQQHNDTGKVFDHIIQTGYPLRMMIYNGDVDMACNFIGDQWFIEAVAKRSGMSVSKDFKEWRYLNQIAGYAKQFKYGSGTIDLVTVKGAGHLVPSDRPGPALQMITNFLRSQDLSNPVPFNTNLTPLKPDYQLQETLTAIVNGTQTSTPKFVGGRRGRLGLKQRSIRRSLGLTESNRVKRAATPAPPPPPNADKNADFVPQLPGLTFNPTFKQYSGYLNASAGNYLHYWLVESQGTPSTDPLILWLNGGPGCSSVGGFLEELGPFHVNKDGATLFENVYSWNKAGNVLFLESPRDVGYSYRSSEFSSDSMYNDTYTTSDAILALQSFFAKFPEYQNRDFYITGESYGGVYVPTLTNALIKQIQTNAMSYVKLVGVAIGNGELSAIQQINSAVSLLYFRGEHGKSDYDALSQCCDGNVTHQTYCNFMQYIQLDSQGNATPKDPSNSLAGQCGRMVVKQGFLDVWETDNDVYNTFQDCYTTSDGSNIFAKNSKSHRSKRDVPILLNNKLYVDQAKKINYQSTDSNGGFSCFSGDASENYMNIPEVRTALHIPAGVPYWTDCNDDINGNYIQQHNDTTSVFNEILQSNYPIRFLIYNGDADMACQFLGDEWFIESLAQNNQMSATSRSEWNYTQNGNLPRIGGYYKTFNYKNSQATFDLLTVKGGGHFVPQDRPGPALQMIYNFIKKTSYSTPLPMKITRQPLKSDYTPAPPQSVPRRHLEMAGTLPGLTFKPQFGQHSGYLKATPGNYLHYWFVESQSNKMTDPILLWMTGGPGCSSLGAILGENGPFLVNPDGKTLFENVYSWNRAASVIYLESPRSVGFSYQDKNVNNDTTWDDTKTAVDVALAIQDFFNTYPQFQKNPFYITGESYGGVYVPVVTERILADITAQKTKCNLQGMAIGNGMLSVIQDIRTLPDYLYYHGIYGKTEWDNLRLCCPNDTPANNQLSCKYEYYVDINTDGSYTAKNFSSDADAIHKQYCADLVISMAQDRIGSSGYDIYNIYQDCYNNGNGVFSLASDRKEKSTRRRFRHQFAAQMSQVNVSPAPVNPLQMYSSSTDAFGGFQCYMTTATTAYLNQGHVRSALNVPDFVQDWQFCKDDINYSLTHHDTTPVFEKIFTYGIPLRIMIYNGDVDVACGLFEAQGMIENLAKRNKFNVTKKRDQWIYGQQTAGYIKKFSNAQLQTHIYLATVKGAGHMVPTDRPGPALQLLNNFLNGEDNYNVPVPFDMTRQPLLPQFTQTGNGALPTVSNSTSAPPVTGSSTTVSSQNVTASSDSTNTPPKTPTTPTTTQTPTTTTSSALLQPILALIISLFMF